MDANNEKKAKVFLEVENLNMLFKVRGSLFQALNNVSFSVNKGDFFGIIGESGSGKSTTGKCIIRLNIPTGGKIEVENNLLSNRRLSRRTDRWLRKNVQMIFQDPMASLNPTKNVLQIISEPLIISKIVYRQTFDYFVKVNQLARYFHYSFVMAQAELNHEFNQSFFKRFTALLGTFNASIRQAIQKNAHKSFDDQHNILLSHYDDLVNEVQNLGSSVHAYVDAYKQLIRTNIDRYDQNNLETIDLNLANAKKQLREKKAELRYSLEGLKLADEIKLARAQRKDLKVGFSETYEHKNYGYVKSWESTVMSKIRYLRQDIRLTKNLLDQYYYKLGAILARHTRSFVKLLKANIYLSEDTISATIALVDGLLARLYAPLMDHYVSQNQNFDLTLDAKQKLVAVDAMRTLVKVARFYCDSFKNDSELEQTAFSAKIKKLIPDSLAGDEFFAGLAGPESFAAVKSIFAQLNQVIAQSQKESKAAFASHRQKVAEIDARLRELKTRRKETVRHHNADLKQNRKDAYFDRFVLAKNDLAQAQREREEKMEFFLGNDWIEFCAQNKKHLAATRQLKRAFRKELKEFAKNIAMIKATLKPACKKENKKWIKNIIGEFKLRGKSLSAIGFEYKTAVRETWCYRQMYAWKPALTWLLYFVFVRLMKRDAVYRALESVGLKREHAYRYPHEFSGGQRQRIVIARALITEPKLIIADEPISALDVSIQAQIINILKKLADQKGITVLFIAHDLSMVNYVCNRAIIMHQGRILEQGDVNAIFSNPIHPYTRSLIKATPKLSRVHVNLSSFDEKMDYERDWSLINPPRFVPVGGDGAHHLVFGTPRQIETWMGQEWNIDDTAAAQKSAEEGTRI